MTSLLSAYTPLESLLLFQALRSEGVHAVSFNRISEQLKDIPLVRDDPTYDSGRLSPDALRELYLRLLKDEVKRDLERQVDANEDGRHATVNGDKSPGSRKRKAASPSLPTVYEAAQHAHLIPQLVSRLYAGYRENTIRGLREDERKYGVLTRELGDIEAGRWDERLQGSRTTLSTQSPKPSTTAHTQPAVAHPDIAPPQLTPAATTPLASPAPSAPAEANSNGMPKEPPQTAINAIINHGQDRSSSPGVHQSTSSSNTGLPSISNIAPKSPARRVHEPIHAAGHVQQQVQYQQQQQQQQGAQQQLPVQAQPPLAIPGGYTPSPPPGRQSPYPHQFAHPIQQGRIPSPQAQQNVPRLPATSLPILPPPQGLKVQAPATQQPAVSTAEATPVQPQYQQLHHPQFGYQPHGPAAPSLTTDLQPHRYTPPSIQQAAPGYHQQQYHPPQVQPQVQTQVQTQSQAQQVPPQRQQTPQAPQRAVYPPPSLPPPQTPTYQGPSTTLAGDAMSASFQPALQPAPEAQHPIQQRQRHPQLHQTPTIQRPRGVQLVPHLPMAPATAPRISTQALRRSMSDIVNGLATPPRPLVQPLWKGEHRPTRIEVSTESARPAVEPMSPTTTQERMRSPARSTRSTRSRDNRAAEAAASQELPMKTRSSRRKTPARAGSPHSVVSSAPDETVRARTRSQSVSTAAGVVAGSDDRPGSSNGVKPEPSTPAGALEDPEPTPAPVSTPAAGARTRKRKGTLQAHVTPASKRKLPDSPGEPEQEAEQPIDALIRNSNNTVTATKNFAKVSAAVMNDINSHKHASYFANAVRDKDAPGYSEIVLQPQNLKSIRAAITAGTRAVNAASSALDSPTATPAASAVRSSEGSSTVELERSTDLVPPKAIVNSAQLEKELMRMFANAYMFNPGEDGMALITKEMSRDVEQTLYNWRATEREAVGDDDDIEGKGKRRKL